MTTTKAIPTEVQFVIMSVCMSSKGYLAILRKILQAPLRDMITIDMLHY